MAIPWSRSRRNVRSARRLPDRRRRFLVEPLEGREMLSTFTVTSTADTTATGTLRWAITQSNKTTGPNTIDFAISGTGVQTIDLGSALPAITQPVTIDGTTQSGYTSSPALAPVIVLNGSGAGTSTVGLNLTASAAGSTVKGLDIQDFSGSGVLINGGSADTITDDLIGLTAAGTAAASNGGDGVTIEGNAAKNTISADVISGNIGSGIDITGSGTTGNVVTGTLIGTNVQGAHAVPNNGGAGVFIWGGASHNTVGGTTAAARNVISGNNSETSGVAIESPSNLVEGNYIGTDSTGKNAVGNGEGVFLGPGATGNTIGGTTAAARNIISANNSYGVQIYNTSNNVVEGDFIGIDASGSLPLGNNEYGYGVTIYGSSGNTIGGTAAGAGDVISGNTSYGVIIYSSSGNLVEGDLIGVTAAGNAPLGNGGDGVLFFESSQNTIGGTIAAARNIISANGGSGIELEESSKDLVEGNYIGTDITGTTAYSGTNPLGNQSYGVELDLASAGNTIAGSTTAPTVISGNRNIGVLITDTGTSGNLVEGTEIGTNYLGNAAVANQSHGLVITNGASGNTVGGTTAGARDVISGNLLNGVALSGTTTTGNVVEGDYIGTNAAGGAALGNGASGVFFSAAPGNTIGGTTAGARNIISGNTDEGVWITSGASGEVIEGDYIGTETTGLLALPNDIGVQIDAASTGNTIGGTTAGARDVISGNSWDGVHIVDGGTTGNVVEGDYIGLNAAGNAALANKASGVAIFAGASGNTVGGTTAGAGDVISGNSVYGVYLSDASTTGNLVAGDLIGTDSTGNKGVDSHGNSLGNGNTGVIIQAGASGNTIGGTTTAARDVISNNAMWGLYITGSTTQNNLVEGDYVGINAAGNAALPNHANGLDIISGATGNTIGGTTAGAADVISGNLYTGVTIYDAPDNDVEGDFIGTNPGGTSAVPNGYYGVDLQAGSVGNSIGGSSTADRNIISGNDGYGVDITDPGTYGNWVQDDFIGTNGSGSSALPNESSGVAIRSGATSNEIYNDVISANASNGVLITDTGTSGNVLSGDLIGLNAAGNAIVYSPNQVYSNNIGVYITNGASSDTVAFSAISGNYTGVQIDGGATGNTIASNDIGTGLSGSLYLGNYGFGVALYNVSGNTVEANNIDNNGAYGIYLYYADQNTLTGNNFANNRDGQELVFG
jgi:parallel beta-helix repeat protein